MSASGHKQTRVRFKLTSALPPLADIPLHPIDVRLVPEAGELLTDAHSTADKDRFAFTVKGLDAFAEVVRRA